MSRQAATAARSAGVAVGTLADYRITPGPPGLVLGYGNITDAGVPEAVRRLGSVSRIAREPA